MSAYLLERMIESVKKVDGGKGEFTDWYIAEVEQELSALRARIAELEADALARLIEEPTNERIMKDVYEENERLQKAVEEAEKFLRTYGKAYGFMVELLTWLKEYGKEIE